MLQPSQIRWYIHHILICHFQKQRVQDRNNVGLHDLYIFKGRRDIRHGWLFLFFVLLQTEMTCCSRRNRDAFLCCSSTRMNLDAARPWILDRSTRSPRNSSDRIFLFRDNLGKGELALNVYSSDYGVNCRPWGLLTQCETHVPIVLVVVVEIILRTGIWVSL